MSNNNLENLLQPSLADTKSISKSYSSTAHFLVSWFGGPLGASLFSIINLRQMGLANKHISACTVLFIVSLIAVAIPFLIIFELIKVPSFLIFDDLKGTGKIAMRLFGVLTYGLFFLVFKRYYIASNQIDAETPSAWTTGSVCAVIGGLTYLSLTLIIGSKM